ncbi:pectate lyase [Microbispora hainanensis]|uniref:pectate lyase n=1 Tax=Microbispora hainanensis TaxID=568844 RepID=A0ABZ1SJ14_9ACTN|nr:pectate lyase [Microbispora hainanensis]
MIGTVVGVAALVGGVFVGVSNAAPSAGPSAGAYRIVNGASGLCLTVPGNSTADGVQLTVSSCNGASNQTWNLSTQGSGFRLAAANSGKCAGVKDASTSAGKAVQQESCTGSTSQTWELTASGSNYRVVNANSDKCLNTKDNSTSSGALVQQNSCDSVSTKQWSLQPAGSQPPASPTPTRTPTRSPSPTPSTNPTPPPSGWPSPNGSQAVTSTISVSGTVDGGLKRYYASGDMGDGGQSESQDPIFELANGATLKNVIIGSPGADGIHCLGSCTLQNVWWEDVGEDAATLLGSSSSQVMTIDGGGARSASDKVFQHNGPGTMIIRNFQVENFGKLYRACGNCTNSYQRHVQMSNIVATSPGKALAGINTNWGDTARFSNITIKNDSSHKIVICEKYKGVPKGSEPTKIGEGADGTNCIYSSSDIHYQ